MGSVTSAVCVALHNQAVVSCSDSGGSSEIAADLCAHCATDARGYSTVTDLARLRGWSTSVPMNTAV